MTIAAERPHRPVPQGFAGKAASRAGRPSAVAMATVTRPAPHDLRLFRQKRAPRRVVQRPLNSHQPAKLAAKRLLKLKLRLDLNLISRPPHPAEVPLISERRNEVEIESHRTRLWRPPAETKRLPRPSVRQRSGHVSRIDARNSGMLITLVNQLETPCSNANGRCSICGAAFRSSFAPGPETMAAAPARVWLMSWIARTGSCSQSRPARRVRSIRWIPQ